MDESLRIGVVIGGFSIITLVATVGSIALANYWAAKRARRQFQLLAEELHLTMQEPAPTWGPRLYVIDGQFSGKSVRIETCLGSVSGILIGNGINTVSRAILTRVRAGETDRIFNWYMTTKRKRMQVMKIIYG